MSAVIDDNFTVRHMTLDDLDEVMRIEHESYEFPWSRTIFGDCLRAGYICTVALSNDRVCGYGLMSHGAGECHVLNLCVEPAARRDGNGTAILDFLVHAARGLGIGTAFLEVRASNTGAVDLYERYGFCETGVRSGYYPHKNGREDALIFSMNII